LEQSDSSDAPGALGSEKSSSDALGDSDSTGGKTE